MPRIKSISIENFRSIGETPVEINFPVNNPVILIGENNSGKSNIIRAIELLFGEFYPKFKKLDDFDHFQRNPNSKISINAEVRDFTNRLGRVREFGCGGFKFTCQKNSENGFHAIQLEDGAENQYVSSKLREELLCVVVNSEQNLSYQLSYASKYTLLSKVTKAFHDKLVEEEDRVNSLKELFDNIKTIFNDVPEFKAFNSAMSTIAGQMIANMSHGLQFDFSAYDPSNYFKTLRIQPTEGGSPRSFEELGTGQQQILALSFAHAYAKSFLGQGLIFVIDEPEAHLHPLAQKWLATQIYKMAQDGLQLIVTTHSPFFIDLKYLNSIYLVKKSDQSEVYNVTNSSFAEYCRQTGAPRADEATISSFYSVHSTPQLLSGFFAKRIILIEGATEEFALPIYLNAVGLDTLKEGIATISVGGKGNLAKWWRLFTAFKIPTFICFDNDLNNDRDGAKRSDALKSIGLIDAEIAELLTTNEWNIGEKYCVFGDDFEATLTSSFDSYQALELEERAKLGDSKPIIAKAVAERLESSIDDIGWIKFYELRKKLLSHE